MNEKNIIWRKLQQYLRGIPRLPLVIILVVVFVAIFANLVAPHDPETGKFNTLKLVVE